MDITLLLDADLDGEAEIIQTGLEEIGWDRILTIEIKRLRDFGLPHNSPDQAIWRFVQQHRLWLVTNNRNSESESSLQATINRENTPDSLPVITTSDKDRLYETEYRRKAMTRLVEILISPESSLGTGRLFIP
ncbi:MAG: ACP S-malonyltransferase [Blastocatellia bacterium]